MRLLLTSHPITSHLVPGLIPLARTAQAMGHEVAVATAASMGSELAGHGVAHLPLPSVAGQRELRTDPALARRYGLPSAALPPESLRMDAATWRAISRAHAGLLAQDFARDLIASDWQPDVLVREPTEWGGYLAAEWWAIPHATLDYNPAAGAELADITDVLAAQRAALGLNPEVSDPHRYLRAGVLPEQCYPPELASATSRYYRTPGPVREPALDADIAALPADRPLVLASLGSLALTLPGMVRVLPTLVEGLAALDCEAVLTLGGRADLAGELGPLPANVHVTAFTPQRSLLGACDLFVTHAGFNAFAEAIAAGVPMVALPSFADQPLNAERIVALGLGERLDLDRLTAEDLSAACIRTLTAPGPRRRVRQLQRLLLGQPGFDHLVTDLESLQPVAATPALCACSGGGQAS